MTKIRIKENDNIEVSIRKFKRLCEKSGVLQKARQHQAYEKPTTKRRREKKIALNKIYLNYKKSILKYKAGDKTHR